MMIRNNQVYNDILIQICKLMLIYLQIQNIFE